MIYKLRCKDMSKVLGFTAVEKDEFSEWYITIGNKRVFLSDPKTLSLYLRRTKKGEIILGNREENGFIFTWGVSDKSFRRYIKIMSSNFAVAAQMLQAFLDKYGSTNWYAKIKKDNPLKELYLFYGFVFKGGRGKEILLAREVINNDKN